MIRIVRPETPPQALACGVTAAEAHCRDFDLDPVLRRTHKGAFTFDESLYGAMDVRLSLQTAQHKKCCYCETFFRQAAPGDIEHFRPKQGWRQVEGGPLQRPGYYWLAYDWLNLLWSCIECNRRHKGSAFPLLDPASRALDHHHAVSGEAPLIIDPCGAADPRDHIRFRREVAVYLTDPGEQTIRLLGLNREGLLEDRRRRLDVLCRERDILLVAEQPDAAENVKALGVAAKRILDHAVLPIAHYSSMARDLLGYP